MVQNEIKSNENPIPREKYVMSWIILEIAYLILIYTYGALYLYMPYILGFAWIFIFSGSEKEEDWIEDFSQKLLNIITGICILGFFSMLLSIFAFIDFSIIIAINILPQFLVFSLFGGWTRQVIYQKRHKNTYAKREPEKKLDMKKPMSVKDRKREVIYAVLFAIGGCILLPLIFFMNEFSNITYVLAIIISCIIGFAIIFRALQVYKRHSRETNQKRIDVRQ